jgi:hypothetical protein
MPALEEMIDTMMREGAVFITMEEEAKEAGERLRLQRGPDGP